MGTSKNKPSHEAALAVAAQELEYSEKEKENSKKEAALKREAELRQRLKDTGLE